MDSVNYEDFQNICRICLLMCGDKLVLQPVISDIYYKLTGIRFETNDKLPQHICFKCFEKFNEIDALALKCKQDNSILMKCFNKYSNDGFNTPVIMDDTVINSYFGLDEFIIEEHKIDFIKDEEFYDCKENAIIDKLPIKTENSEQSDHQNINSVQNDLQIEAENPEENSCEINNDRNSVQDDENVQNEEILQDKTNQNLNEDTNSQMRKLCNKTCLIILNKYKHSGRRSFACKNCSKTFTRTAALKRHEYIHSGERPFECEICNKKFSQLYHLNTHRRIHSGERPYECEICNKTFKQSSHLKTHQFLHSGKRLYPSEICEKTFISPQSLKKHKRVYSGERNMRRKSLESSSVLKNRSVELLYECDVCTKSYRRLSVLQGHKKTHIRI